jgi:hypothetical protein
VRRRARRPRPREGCTVQYSTVQHSTVQHSTAQHITAQHSTCPGTSGVEAWKHTGGMRGMSRRWDEEPSLGLQLPRGVLEGTYKPCFQGSFLAHISRISCAFLAVGYLGIQEDACILYLYCTYCPAYVTPNAITEMPSFVSPLHLNPVRSPMENTQSSAVCPVQSVWTERCHSG